MSNIGLSPRSLNRQLPLLLLVLVLAVGCAQEAPSTNDTANTPAADTASPAEVAAKADTTEATAPPSLGLLISAEQLQQQSTRAGVRILDARSQAEFDAGHIPDAVPIDVAAWKSLTLKDAGVGLYDQSAWSKVVGDLGIDGETPVVVYSSSPTSAARIWWILKYVGVKDAGILDGGWAAWKATKGEISTAEVGVEPVEFTPSFQDDRLAMIGDLKKSHAASDLIVVDARSLGEFQGQGDGKGRIPGAAHLEWSELLTADGHYKTVEELKRLFEQHGITSEKTVVTHCQTGGRASVNVFALELAGYGKVKNYYSGWSEWGHDSKAPREQGAPKP